MAPKATTHKSVTQSAKAHGSTKTTTKTTAKTTVTKGKTTTGSDAKTVPTTTATSTNLPKNPRLVERLAKLLPEGTDMNLAALGFKNQGQFVAAVHVSNNLGIPFAQLKLKMVEDHLSLGPGHPGASWNRGWTDRSARAELQARVDRMRTS
jgi:hypothetical protein